MSKISSEANAAVGKDVSDVIGSGIGKDTSNWESADEPIVQANASGDTIPRFSENKFEIGNKVVNNINKPMVASDIAVKSSEAVVPKIDEVLVGSLAGKVAVDEASIERAANIIDKTSEAEEVRKVVGAGDETEIETSVNVFKKSGEGAEVGGKSVDEAELGSGKMNGGDGVKCGFTCKEISNEFGYKISQKYVDANKELYTRYFELKNLGVTHEEINATLLNDMLNNSIESKVWFTKDTAQNVKDSLNKAYSYSKSIDTDLSKERYFDIKNQLIPYEPEIQFPKAYKIFSEKFSRRGCFKIASFFEVMHFYSVQYYIFITFYKKYCSKNKLYFIVKI